MNLSSLVKKVTDTLTGAAGKTAATTATNAANGMGDLLAKAYDVSGLDDVVAKASTLGLSDGALREVLAKVKEFAGQGMIGAEIEKRVLAFAQEKGLPVPVVQTVLGMLRGRTTSGATQVGQSAQTPTPSAPIQ